MAKNSGGEVDANAKLLTKREKGDDGEHSSIERLDYGEEPRRRCECKYIAEVGSCGEELWRRPQ